MNRCQVSGAKLDGTGDREQEDTSRGQKRKLPSVAAATEGVPLPAFSPARQPTGTGEGSVRSRGQCVC